jgi:hypothetical protein
MFVTGHLAGFGELSIFGALCSCVLGDSEETLSQPEVDAEHIEPPLLLGKSLLALKRRNRGNSVAASSERVVAYGENC